MTSYRQFPENRKNFIQPILVSRKFGAADAIKLKSPNRIQI